MDPSKVYEDFSGDGYGDRGKDMDRGKERIIGKYFESYKDERKREEAEDALAKYIYYEKNMRAYNEANKRSSVDWRMWSK